MIPFYPKAAFDLPSGPKNLTDLLGIDFSTISEYHVQLLDDTDNVIVTTPVIKVCNCEDTIRVHFESYLGRFDAVSFERVKVVHNNGSAEYKRSLPDSFEKTDAGIERFNVRSNKTWEAVTYRYEEEDMDWLMECADSAKALLEWSGTQGQSDSFLPIVILNGSWEKRKFEDRFVYEFRIQFKMGNENIIIRN
jgi:hypothetical protein